MDAEVRDYLKIRKDNIIEHNIKKTIQTLNSYNIVGKVKGNNKVYFSIKEVEYNYDPIKNKVHIVKVNLNKTVLELLKELKIEKKISEGEPLFTFGKYNNIPVAYVIETDKDYIEWFKKLPKSSNNVINFQFIIKCLEKKAFSTKVD